MDGIYDQRRVVTKGWYNSNDVFQLLSKYLCIKLNYIMSQSCGDVLLA